MSLLIILLALLLDKLFGELPNRWHPLVWFGKVAIHVEYRFNQSTLSNWQAFWHGLAATLLLVIVPAGLLIIILMNLPIWISLLLQVVVLWFCIGWNSLTHHVKAIATPLAQGDLIAARQALSLIVSRDTHALSERKIATATIESLLENGNDAIFASLFWFVIGGAPAALAHRLVNTLDAMWGYRNTRFEYFGKAAAKIDDILNYLPARLTALSYALISPRRQAALACWQRQAHKHDSPNAGVVMATGAGALGLRLGGSASYEGIREKRPIFGFDKTPSAKDINHALRLINKTLLLWLVLIAALYL